MSGMLSALRDMGGVLFAMCVFRVLPVIVPGGTVVTFSSTRASGSTSVQYCRSIKDMVAAGLKYFGLEVRTRIFLRTRYPSCGTYATRAVLTHPVHY
eukprot:1481446-Rhodomonas_salina.1